MSRFHRLPVLVTLVSLGVAGTAAAFYLHGRREVTTSSKEALRCYRLGRENEEKLYDREALAAYAEALRHDPHFVMATVRLAGFLRGRDPERAKSLVDCVSRYRDAVTPKEELWLRIFEAQQGKDPAKVEQLVDDYVARFPEDPEGYQWRANRLARRGKVAEAVAEYQRLLTVNPNYAVAYNTLGYYYAKAGDYGKGEDYLKRYRFLAPDQANPYDSLGELYANIGRYDEAEESLKKALAIKPDFYPSVAHLGTVAMGRGDMAAAAAHFKKAAELVDTPGMRAEFTAYAAFALASSGKGEDAKQLIAAIDKHVASLSDTERKRQSSELKLNQAALYALLGETDTADQILASLTPPSAPEPNLLEKSSVDRYEKNRQVVLGLVANRRGRHAEAIAALESGLQHSEDPMGGFSYFPIQPMLRITLASSLRELGRTEEAEKALQPVFARNPRFQPALTELARLKESAAETLATRS